MRTNPYLLTSAALRVPQSSSDNLLRNIHRHIILFTTVFWSLAMARLKNSVLVQKGTTAITVIPLLSSSNFSALL